MRRYYRNGPEHRAGADVCFADIVSLFGFYSIRIGRWVTASEQQQAANLFFDALCDLQHLLQVPTQVLSLRGSLALHYGIGGRPGASAHYMPQGRVLALAKNAGGGSLAHEWFHAFDHYICGKMFDDQPPPLRFASRHWLHSQDINPHPLNTHLDSAFRHLFTDDGGTQSGAFMRHCIAYDKRLGSQYFGMPEEVAARSFEAIIQRQQLKNHFLVAGTQQTDVAKAGLYPPLPLQDRVASSWFSYFQLLGQALNQVNR
ncbi:MAG: CLCA_X family protein [Pseudomonadota bacterium]